MPDDFTIVEDTQKQLKPCPFCGGPAAFENDTGGVRPVWRVYCRDADDVCPIGFSNTRGYARKTEVIRAWNERRDK